MRPRARIGIAVDHMLGFFYASSHWSTHAVMVHIHERLRARQERGGVLLPQFVVCHNVGSTKPFLNNCANLIGRPPPSSSDGVGAEGVRPAVVGDGLLVEF